MFPWEFPRTCEDLLPSFLPHLPFSGGRHNPHTLMVSLQSRGHMLPPLNTKKLLGVIIVPGSQPKTETTLPSG